MRYTSCMRVLGIDCGGAVHRVRRGGDAFRWAVGVPDLRGDQTFARGNRWRGGCRVFMTNSACLSWNIIRMKSRLRESSTR